jgi:hypothetical protein
MMEASLPLMDMGTDNRKRLWRLLSVEALGELPAAAVVLFIVSSKKDEYSIGNQKA